VQLKELAGVKVYRGITTGLNDVYLIDDATKERLIKDDPRCESIIRRRFVAKTLIDGSTNGRQLG